MIVATSLEKNGWLCAYMIPLLVLKLCLTLKKHLLKKTRGYSDMLYFCMVKQNISQFETEKCLNSRSRYSI